MNITRQNCVETKEPRRIFHKYLTKLDFLAQGSVICDDTLSNLWPPTWVDV